MKIVQPQHDLRHPHIIVCHYLGCLVKGHHRQRQSQLRLSDLCTCRLSVSNGEKNPPHFSIVCEAALTKRVEFASKRAHQAEKRRLYNKARKYEIRTRMKKVLAFCFS
ncbi:hypothetical protein NL676_023940 [Syzygium grande]|nr:hypothetical protein NL676_023940 [Syzygium grande]